MQTVAPEIGYLAPYRIVSRVSLLDAQPRRYVLKIHDLPQSEKPREKLLAGGPGALSVQELIAVLIGIGTTKEDVLAMSARIIKEYGEHSIMQARDATALSRDLSIPQGKAMQIIAAAELGRRFFCRNGASTPTTSAFAIPTAAATRALYS